MLLHNHLSSFLQIAGTAVITQTLPQLQKLLFHILFGFTAAKAPAMRPQVNLNQPEVTMTDMEDAQRTALSAAMQNAIAKLRTLPAK